MNAPRAAVLYDADCVFCRCALGLLLAWDRDRALDPVPIGSATGERLLAGLDAEERLSSWHLVLGDRRFSGGSATAPLLRLLPGGVLPASLLALAPGLTERAYRWVARNRGRLGRRLPAAAISRADARIRERRERAG